MRTSLPRVLAAGDCVHTTTGCCRADLLAAGQHRPRQGRVAGATAGGCPAAFAGSLGTQVVKVFDLVAARTGLRDAQAVAAGYQPLTVAGRADDHKAYTRRHPDRDAVDRGPTDRAAAQRPARRPPPREIAKRVDVAAAALFAGLTVEQVSDLDLSYTPPLGSPWDALQIGAQASTRAARHCPRA